MSDYPKTIAVDFDGCLCSRAWPNIGEPNIDAINALIRRKERGDKIILWTCRDGEMLEQAVLWCRKHGIEFDAVNDNLPEHKEFFGGNSRKVYANEYWDDAAVYIAAPDRKREA